jgi:hypothetical protein
MPHRAGLLGFGHAFFFARTGAFELQGVFVMLDVHRVIVTFAVPALPLENGMVKDGTICFQIEGAAFAIFDRFRAGIIHRPSGFLLTRESLTKDGGKTKKTLCSQ